MTYLVDTDRVVDYLDDRFGARLLLDGLLRDGLTMSIISLGELLEGIYYGRDRKQYERGLRGLLRTVRVIGLNRPIMRGQLRRDGNLIGDMDLLIASTALVNDLTLVTRNRRHFERVPGLELYQDS
jgi:tRNA(fMet)-specific endonuclease VapC